MGSRNDVLSSSWKDGIFENKVVFCTGGAGSICSVQVRAMVYLGANACIIGRNEKKSVEAAASIASVRRGAKVIGIGGCDVRSADSLQGAVDRCIKELGAIDFVIAGAAGNFLAPITALSSNAFKAVMDIDVLGSYNTLKTTLPHLVASAARNPNTGSNSSTGGRIIFVSATLHYAGTPLQAHVSAAKAAVDALSTSTSIELGPHGVTSNIIAPGPIAGTEGMERLTGDEGRKSQGRSTVPLGRWGRTKEIADATVYLFADTGSFVNGSTVVVDGGSWRLGLASTAGAQYPDFLLGGVEEYLPKGAKTGRRAKI